ncbi:hypothetical protein PHLCEN_2v3609 [Hermanssonia centrifuga]|uniref:DUF427 domain-containing protein n=1 Tax=Hermanssonia centrifuga TaxID=98765 RepID=A0A2R6QEL1_9APHY|nr:hypothetical protein PHLCEN_2v3609 [Hermanssonia centrifuga]
MVKVTVDGTVLAQSDKTVKLEGNHYFPPESCNEDLLTPSPTVSYPQPKEAAKSITGHLAFDKWVFMPSHWVSVAATFWHRLHRPRFRVRIGARLGPDISACRVEFDEFTYISHPEATSWEFWFWPPSQLTPSLLRRIKRGTQVYYPSKDHTGTI